MVRRKLDNRPVFCNSNCDHRSRQAKQSAPHRTSAAVAGRKQPRRAAVSGRRRLMSKINQFTRRSLLKTAGGIALVSGISAPAILRAQTADVIRIGHLTPRTGFLGPLGEYAVMAVDLAVEEINASGGMMGTQGRAAERGFGQSADRLDQGRAHDRARQGRLHHRRDFFRLVPDHRAGRLAQQDPVHQHRRQFGRAARQGLPALHVPRRVAEFDVCEDRRPLVPARRTGQGQEVVLADGGLRVRP